MKLINSETKWWLTGSVVSVVAFGPRDRELDTHSLLRFQLPGGAWCCTQCWKVALMVWAGNNCDFRHVAVIGRLFTFHGGAYALGTITAIAPPWQVYSLPRTCQLSLPSLRGWYMRNSFGWEGKRKFGSFNSCINAWVVGKTVKSFENACHT